MVSKVWPRVVGWWPYARKPVAFLLVLVIGMGVYWHALLKGYAQTREQVRSETLRQAGQTSQALALQMQTTVRSLDYFSRHLSWLWLLDGPEAFMQGVLLAKQTLPAGALMHVLVTDASGSVRYSSLRDGINLVSSKGYSVADRDYFLYHLEARRSVFHVGAPVEGRISRQVSVPFSRGLWLDGEFQGVLMLGVSAGYLAGFLQAVFPEEHDAASLVSEEGVYLARSYHQAAVLGKGLPLSTPLMMAPGRQFGTFEVTADIDNIHRLYSWRRVPDYPLAILVGLGSEQATAVSEQAIRDSHIQHVLASVLLLVGGCALAALWIQRSRRATQLQQVAEALQASQTQLRLTLDAVRDGLWTYDHLSRTLQWDEGIRDILGYGEDWAAPTMDQAWQLVHPDDQPRLTRSSEEFLRRSSDQILNVEFRMRRGDGRWLWVLARGRVIEHDASGRALRSVGTLSDIHERVADAHLRHALLDRSAASILLVSPDRRIYKANAQFESLFLKPGQTVEELDLHDLHVDDTHWHRLGAMYAAVRIHGQVRVEYPFRTAKGEVRWFDTHAILQDPEDPDSNVIWTWVDITSRREADAALVVETQRLNTLLECYPGGVLIEDANDKVVFVNANWPKLLGLKSSANQLLGLHDTELRKLIGPKISDWLRSHLAGRSRETRSSHEVMTDHGRHLEIDHVEVRQETTYLGSVWLVRDITERKQHELELAQLAATDTLTGLPNRRSFLKRLRAMHAEAQALGRPTGAVLMLDIDYFKLINDTYGHAVGDLVLQRVAQMLREALRSNDLPGRLGGEEFAVLVSQVDVLDGMLVAGRIHREVEEQVITVDDLEIRVTISIGVALLDQDMTPEKALQRADEALYRAKFSGRSQVKLWRRRSEDPPVPAD